MKLVCPDTVPIPYFRQDVEWEVHSGPSPKVEASLNGQWQVIECGAGSTGNEWGEVFSPGWQADGELPHELEI